MEVGGRVEDTTWVCVADMWFPAMLWPRSLELL
jgi:hypothetical protein